MMPSIKQFAVRCLSIALFAAPFAAGAQSEAMDEDIARAVQKELAYSDVVPSGQLRVTVDGGVVALEGTVATLIARSQAEDIAAAVNGVRAITNSIDVETTDPDPAVLTANVEQALARNSATDSYEIEVSASADGKIALTGTVDSWAERNLAGTVTSTVPGVTAIANELEVDTSRYYRGNEEIHADVAERLRWDARVDSDAIEILVRDGGRVILAGSAASLAEKRLAEQMAYVEGVREVDAEHLEVAQ